MGVRGIVPAPDNVRRLRGMKPLTGPDGKKARRIVLAPKAPAPPRGLSRAAAAEWRRIVPELERAGVLAQVDRGILVAYCTAWAHMMEAEAMLQDAAVVHEGRQGIVKHPAWQVYREANRTLVAAAGQLYLTPVARLRIPLAPGAMSDDGSDDDLFD